jgi:hypothetical protein
MESLGKISMISSKNTKMISTALLSAMVQISIMFAPFAFHSAVQSADAQADEIFKTYENPKFGLVLSYPPTWSVDELRKDPGAPANNSIVAIFKSPSQGQNDKYLENVIVNIQGPRKDIVSLEHYTQNSLKAFNNLSNIKILNSSKDTLAGLPAHQLIYTSSAFPGLDLKKMQVFTVVNNNTAYVVTFSGEEPQYDKNLPVIEKMINSLNVDKDVVKDLKQNKSQTT